MTGSKKKNSIKIDTNLFNSSNKSSDDENPTITINKIDLEKIIDKKIAKFFKKQQNDQNLTKNDQNWLKNDQKSPKNDKFYSASFDSGHSSYFAIANALDTLNQSRVDDFRIFLDKIKSIAKIQNFEEKLSENEIKNMNFSTEEEKILVFLNKKAENGSNFENFVDGEKILKKLKTPLKQLNDTRRKFLTVLRMLSVSLIESKVDFDEEEKGENKNSEENSAAKELDFLEFEFEQIEKEIFSVTEQIKNSSHSLLDSILCKIHKELKPLKLPISSNIESRLLTSKNLNSINNKFENKSVEKISISPDKSLEKSFLKSPKMSFIKSPEKSFLKVLNNNSEDSLEKNYFREDEKAFLSNKNVFVNQKFEKFDENDQKFKNNEFLKNNSNDKKSSFSFDKISKYNFSRNEFQKGKNFKDKPFENLSKNPPFSISSKEFIPKNFDKSEKSNKAIKPALNFNDKALKNIKQNELFRIDNEGDKNLKNLIKNGKENELGENFKKDQKLNEIGENWQKYAKKIENFNKKLFFENVFVLSKYFDSDKVNKMKKKIIKEFLKNEYKNNFEEQKMENLKFDEDFRRNENINFDQRKSLLDKIEELFQFKNSQKDSFDEEYFLRIEDLTIELVEIFESDDIFEWNLFLREFFILILTKKIPKNSSQKNIFDILEEIDHIDENAVEIFLSVFKIYWPFSLPLIFRCNKFDENIIDLDDSLFVQQFNIFIYYLNNINDNRILLDFIWKWSSLILNADPSYISRQEFNFLLILKDYLANCNKGKSNIQFNKLIEFIDKKYRIWAKFD